MADAATKPTNLTRMQLVTPIGTTGLKEQGGEIYEEFLRRLQGRNGIELYREMSENSPVIGAALAVIELLVRQVDWRIEPAKIDGEETEETAAEAEFVEGALQDMSHTFEDFISEVLSMLVYGWSYFEIVYKIRRGETKDPKTRSKFADGAWGWRKFEIRSQETLDRWGFDDEGGIRGMMQLDQMRASNPVFIPIEKALLFRTKVTRGNPEGKSLLRPGVLTYHGVKRIEQFEGIGVERDLAGMPIMEVPPDLLVPNAGADATQLRGELEKFVTSVRMDERWGGLVPSETKPDGKPSGYKFKLLSSGGSRMINTNEIIKRKETRLLMLFLAQFLVMGMDKVGSLALSSNMTGLFATAIGAYMGTISSVFNRFAIRRLQALNGRPQELDPVLTHGDIEGPNLDELGKFLVALTTAGVDVSDPAIRRKLLEGAGLPIDIEDPDTEGDPEQADPQGPPPPPPPPAPESAEPETTDPPDDEQLDDAGETEE